MTAMLDLGPAARQMASLLDGITDEQLTAPTPCDEYTLGDLIDHVSGLSQAFTAAKDFGPRTSQALSAEATRLDDDWHTRVPERLAALVEAVSLMSTPEGSEGLFGPAFDVPADAPPLIRVLGLSGRDPSWGHTGGSALLPGIPQRCQR